MDSAVLILFISVIIIGIGLMIIIGLTRRPPRMLDRKKYQEDWMSIEQSLGDDGNSMQFSIMQADKLLDRALKERGFAGETMGERLKSAKTSFTNLNAVWAAHKLRNRIAHEDKVKMDRRIAKQALGAFKRALRDLGAL